MYKKPSEMDGQNVLRRINSHKLFSVNRYFLVSKYLLTHFVFSCHLVVSRLSVGSSAEAEEGSLAGASHPEAVHRL